MKNFINQLFKIRAILALSGSKYFNLRFHFGVLNRLGDPALSEDEPAGTESGTGTALEGER